MRIVLAAVLLLAAISQGGCATIFTGTGTSVKFHSAPDGANVAVVGGALGDALLEGKKYSEHVQLAVKFLRTVAPETWGPGLDMLAVLHVEEFLTLVLPMVRVNEMPELLRHLPPFVFPPKTDFALLQILGVEAYGTAPLRARIGKGKQYAVLFWKKGRKARVVAMDKSFNPMFLLNILNAFLLCPVDIVTGAWYSIGPSEIEADLPPLPPDHPAIPKGKS
jgi:hypothetical protein